jgi:hypothetical protein
MSWQVVGKRAERLGEVLTKKNKYGRKCLKDKFPTPALPTVNLKMQGYACMKPNKAPIFAASKAPADRANRFLGFVCACGEIGRRAVFRRQFRKVWEFESPRAHNYPEQKASSATGWLFCCAGASSRPVW